MARNQSFYALFGMLALSPLIHLWNFPKEGQPLSTRFFFRSDCIGILRSLLTSVLYSPGVRGEDGRRTLSRFTKHLARFEAELNRIRSHELRDWKRNENVSVGVEETGASHLIRVISLQSGGNPGIMQVCPFVDAVHTNRTASMVLWKCKKGLLRDEDFEKNGVPCSELGTQPTSDRKSRFVMKLKFRTMDATAEYRCDAISDLPIVKEAVAEQVYCSSMQVRGTRSMSLGSACLHHHHRLGDMVTIAKRVRHKHKESHCHERTEGNRDGCAERDFLPSALQHVKTDIARQPEDSIVWELRCSAVDRRQTVRVNDGQIRNVELLYL
eukprot:767230-Hanusia_phi.AAC.2